MAILDTPADGTSGLPVELAARATTRVKVRPVDPPGPEVFVGPHRARPASRPARRSRVAAADEAGVGDTEWVTLLPEHRGVYHGVVLEVATAAPFGLLWWRKTVVLDLPRPLHVGPRMGRPLPLRRGREDTAGSGMLDASVQIGEPRGVRPYRPGDHRRWVHWPATAHSGELMVREMEGPTAEPVTLEVRLPPRRGCRRAPGGTGHGDHRGARRPGDLGAAGNHRGPGAEGRRCWRQTQCRSSSGTGRGRWRRYAGRWPWRASWSSVHERHRSRETGQPTRATRALDHVASGVRGSGGDRHRRVPGGGGAVVDGRRRLDDPRRGGHGPGLPDPERPLPWIKPILALSAVAAFVWFFRQLTGQTIYDVSTVENPLAVLFVWVQVAHAFDVPARRDLAFSLAGSASLVAVAAAQAIDLAFGVYVLVWLAFGLAGLLAMWSSASDGGRLQSRGVIATFVAVAVTGAGVLVVLPAPHVAGRIDFPTNAGPGTALPVPGGLAGDGKVAQLAKPGSPADATRVGGYLGFATRLNTALRGGLSDAVVMRVRADRPSYWVGETFDTWDGANWGASAANRVPQRLNEDSPFILPGPAPTATTQTDLQTFYVVQSSPDLVFHADTARQVWFPARDSLRGGKRLDRVPHRARPRCDLHGAVLHQHPLPGRTTRRSGSGCRSGLGPGAQHAASELAPLHAAPRRWPSP